MPAKDKRLGDDYVAWVGKRYVISAELAADRMPPGRPEVPVEGSREVAGASPVSQPRKLHRGPSRLLASGRGSVRVGRRPPVTDRRAIWRHRCRSHDPSVGELTSPNSGWRLRSWPLVEHL